MSAPPTFSGASRRPHRSRPQPSNSRPEIPAERTVGLRSFGGQLTRLQANAPSFVPASLSPASVPSGLETSVSGTTSSTPGRPRQQLRQPRPFQRQHQSSAQNQTAKPQNQPSPNVAHRPKRKASISRSTAPDIATRTHDDIAKAIYECAICTNEIGRNSKIWSCQTCWTVFHLSCIKTWSKNVGSGVQPESNNPENEEEPARRQWRCPGCNLPKDNLPSAYTCWCEKEINPKTINGLPPHSCGQTCGRSRTFPKVCPHPCDLVCHAGPCPPCTSIGPQQMCFCGKELTARKCADTDYTSGWSCGKDCSDIMPCGEHQCPRPCHEGLCGACEVEVEARCYCGKNRLHLPCHEKGEEKQSYDWIGSYDCHQQCDNLMDCGLHRCQKQCHPQNESVPHCPRSPDAITRCPCGKTPIEAMLSEPRKNCTDLIPHCDKPCGKKLPCGHSCKQLCHLGDCNSCLLKVPITCRCGRNVSNTVCQQGTEEAPHCFRSCKTTLNCGRHECGERCCPGERKAIERQATKRKLKPLGVAATLVDEGVEAEHICTRICERSLKCGNHPCPDLCHKGPCASCKEAIFEDLSCNCGRTVLQAPLPCGTQPPPCTFPCHRPKNCGHAQVPHNCHINDEKCPNCPYLTVKICNCGKKALKNQPCWRTEILCGLKCGKLLKCGSHTCEKLCHRPGDCEDAYTPCQHECSKPKKTCGHPCERVCHAPSVCKEDRPCRFKIIITCDCQRKKEEVRCNVGPQLSDSAARQTSLKCDDECARLERNRRLALALHISDDHQDEHIPYSNTTLNMYVSEVTWAHKQEELLRVFAADPKENRLRFPPMKSTQRAFIHSLAEDFGFDAESLDPEPHRHIVIFKTPKFVAAPMKTLAQAARIKRAALNIPAPAAALVPETRVHEVSYEYNGLLLTNPRFALTEDELRNVLALVRPTVEFDIIFMHSGDALALLPSQSWEIGDENQMTTFLKNIYPALAAEINKKGLADSVTLCQFETGGAEPRVLYQQGKSEMGAVNGWSKVAAKKAAPMQAPRVQPVGQRSAYTVLGSRMAEAKKKKMEEDERKKLQQMEAEEVAEDWEREYEKDEEASVEGSKAVVASDSM